MTIGFAPNVSVELIKHSSAIKSMENEIDNLAKEKNYGEDISELFIGIVSVSPQFEQFFKPRSPKYTKGHKSYSKEDVHYKVYNCFEYDIRLDFESLKNATELEVKKMIAQELLSSLDMFKKFKKFDSNQFKSDLEALFKSKGWI
jgi:hypothetical protein